MSAFWESSEIVLQRHRMFSAIRAASLSDYERLLGRIHRLETERTYSLPGWRVAVRRAIMPVVVQAPAAVIAPVVVEALPVVLLLQAPPAARLPGWATHVRQWLNHPLIEIGKAA